MTKEQLHRLTRHRIDELRLTDDPRVTEAWTGPQAQAAIADYLGRLARRAPEPAEPAEPAGSAEPESRQG